MLFPPGLAMLDVSENNISGINSNVIEQLNRIKTLQNVSLSHNPLDCSIKDLHTILIMNFAKITDLNEIRCANGEPLPKMNNVSVANNTISFTYFVVISLLFLLIGAIIALCYKYEQEVKVWMYAHNLCMRLFAEEELDKKYDAFISFSQMDDDFVLGLLVPELEDGPNPYKLCLNLRDWVIGDSIPDQVSHLFDLYLCHHCLFH